MEVQEEPRGSTNPSSASLLHISLPLMGSTSKKRKNKERELNRDMPAFCLGGQKSPERSDLGS